MDRRAARVMVLLWYCGEKTTEGISSFCILREARVGESQVPRCYSVNECVDGMEAVAAFVFTPRQGRDTRPVGNLVAPGEGGGPNTTGRLIAIESSQGELCCEDSKLSQIANVREGNTVEV